MKTVTFTYLDAKCEYNFKTKNLHITSKKSFNSTNQTSPNIISPKHNIEKKDIKTITFKHPNTKLPSHLYYYFLNYPNLEYIELEKLDFENVKTINGFITNCPKLKDITIAQKNAKNLISIKDFIGQTKHTKSITIKNINAPNLQKVEWLLWLIEGDIKEITIENITAPNINSINYLIHSSYIKTLDFTKIGNTRVNLSQALIANGNELDLNKFEDITSLTSHFNLAGIYLKNQQYPSIKIGRHKLKFSEYSVILENNIHIVDKTEEEIVKELITQSKNETKRNIENFLETLENKKIFKNEEYKKQLKSKLTIIKNLK